MERKNEFGEEDHVRYVQRGALLNGIDHSHVRRESQYDGLKEEWMRQVLKKLETCRLFDGKPLLHQQTLK
jgi:hypothetical protein